MTTATRIIDFINGINIESVISKKEKEEIKQKLLFIQTLVKNDKEKQKLEKIIEIFNKGRLTDDDKKQIIKMKEKTTEIVEKYENEFNILENIDITNDNLDNDEIEKTLDNTVNSYNFNAQHPMTHVSYDKTNKKYKVQINEERHTKNLTEACEIAKNFIMDQKIKFATKLPSEYFILPVNVSKVSKKYYNSYIIKYKYCGKLYYDIQHILKSLGLTNDRTHGKYKIFRSEIKKIFIDKNVFGGYTFRELIDKITVKKIICSCNKPVVVKLCKLFDINTYECAKITKEMGCIDKILRVFKHTNYKLQHSCKNYRVDLFLLDYDLVIECDENGHADREPEYEENRQKFIEQKYGAKFIRFNPDAENFDILEVISDIHVHIVNTLKNITY